MHAKHDTTQINNRNGKTRKKKKGPVMDSR